MSSDTPIRDWIESEVCPKEMDTILFIGITEEEKQMFQALLDEEMPGKRAITERDPEAWGF